MKIKDSNVTIMVKNMDKSIDFYQKIGLKLQQRWGDNYAMISGGGVTLGIHPGGDKKSSSGTVSIGFMIKDIKKAAALLEKNKIKFKAQQDGKSGSYIHFSDPDKTALYFVEPNW
jgi:catechol 2,3-dioxygenase-like lactoylglutathione lyase family enzyme